MITTGSRSLLRIGCGLSALIIGLGIEIEPVRSGQAGSGLSLMSKVHADDDDGDDGGDDGGGSSSGSSAGSSSSGGGGGRGSGGGAIFRPGGGSGGLFRWFKNQTGERKPRRTVRRPPSPVVLPDAVPREVVGVGIDEAQIAALEGDGFEILEREDLDSFGTNVTKLRYPRRLNFEQARSAVRARSPAATIDRNHLYSPQEASPEPACTGEDCLARDIISWAPPTETAACSAKVRLGMIDTAINGDHAALRGARLEVMRFAKGDLPESDRQHGTAVAALFVGAADGRSPGLLPGASLIAVDTFTGRAGGTDASDAYSIARGLDFLVGRDVDVVNLSLAGPANAVLELSVAEARRNDVMLVAAAGNEGPRAEPVYPAAYAEVLTVTAVDRNKRAYRRAGRGDHVDIAAPGVGVWTAASISGSRTKTGTSFAVPFVSAAAAIWRANDPASRPDDVEALLAAGAEDLGKPGKDEVFGWGLLSPDGLCPVAKASPADPPPAAVPAIQDEPL